jgi:hypothetical protein
VRGCQFGDVRRVGSSRIGPLFHHPSIPRKMHTDGLGQAGGKAGETLD